MSFVNPNLLSPDFSWPSSMPKNPEQWLLRTSQTLSTYSTFHTTHMVDGLLEHAFDAIPVTWITALSEMVGTTLHIPTKTFSKPLTTDSSNPNNLILNSYTYEPCVDNATTSTMMDADAALEQMLWQPEIISSYSKMLPPDLLKLLNEIHGSLLNRSAIKIKQCSFPSYLRRIKGFSPKKEHETTRLAALLKQVAYLTQSKILVDVGSGSGYLGHVLLNTDPTFIVAGIEGDVQQHTLARKKLERMEQLHRRKSRQHCERSATMSKQSNGASESTSNLTNHLIVTEGILSTHTFEENMAIITRAVEESRQRFKQVQDTESTETAIDMESEHSSSEKLDETGNKSIVATTVLPVILTCLHGCGDLTPCLLESFIHHEACRGLVSIGCCYHAITPIHGAEKAWYIRQRNQHLPRCKYTISEYKQKQALKINLQSLPTSKSSSASPSPPLSSQLSPPITISSSEKHSAAASATTLLDVTMTVDLHKHQPQVC